jgi:hypothetical protein
MRNLYFQYQESRRLLQEAQRSHRIKAAETARFMFDIYSSWCKEKFGVVIRPWSFKESKFDRPVKIFFEELEIYDIAFRSQVTRLLDQIFDEKEANSR